jgi:hypothetical protein
MCCMSDALTYPLRIVSNSRGIISFELFSSFHLSI